MWNYTDFRNSDFGSAFNKLCTLEPGKYGIRLSTWEAEVLVKVQMPDDNSYMTEPYLYKETKYSRVPWVPTQEEMFSNEWSVVSVIDSEHDKFVNKMTASKYNNMQKDKEFENKKRAAIEKLMNNKVADRCSEDCIKRCLHECIPNNENKVICANDGSKFIKSVIFKGNKDNIDAKLISDLIDYLTE